MNIFVTNPSPQISAQVLPDKHVVKMPLETCQMLSIVCSDKWGHGYGQIHRVNGEAYKTDKANNRRQTRQSRAWVNTYPSELARNMGLWGKGVMGEKRQRRRVCL